MGKILCGNLVDFKLCDKAVVNNFAVVAPKMRRKKVEGEHFRSNKYGHTSTVDDSKDF